MRLCAIANAETIFRWKGTTGKRAKQIRLGTAKPDDDELKKCVFWRSSKYAGEVASLKGDLTLGVPEVLASADAYEGHVTVPVGDNTRTLCTETNLMSMMAAAALHFIECSTDDPIDFLPTLLGSSLVTNRSPAALLGVGMKARYDNLVGRAPQLHAFHVAHIHFYVDSPDFMEPPHVTQAAAKQLPATMVQSTSFQVLDLVLVAPERFTIASPFIVWRMPWRVSLYSFVHRTFSEQLFHPDWTAQPQLSFVPAKTRTLISALDVVSDLALYTKHYTVRWVLWPKFNMTIKAINNNLVKHMGNRDKLPRVSTSEEMQVFSKGLALTADVVRSFDARRDSTLAEAIKKEAKEKRKKEKDEAKVEGQKLAGELAKKPDYLRDELLNNCFPVGKAPPAQVTQDGQQPRSSSASSLAESAGTGETPSKKGSKEKKRKQEVQTPVPHQQAADPVETAIATRTLKPG